MFINYKSRAGQTIIEAAVALSVILLIMAAIAVVVTTSVNNSSFIRSQTLASKYAQQGMEQIRYLRNNYPTTFNNLAGSSSTYCFNIVNNNNLDDLGQNSGNYLISSGSSCININIPEVSLKREVVFGNASFDCGVQPTTPPSSPVIYGTKVTVTVYWASGKCDISNRYCHKTQVISCFSKQSSSGFTL